MLRPVSSRSQVQLFAHVVVLWLSPRLIRLSMATNCNPFLVFLNVVMRGQVIYDDAHSVNDLYFIGFYMNFRRDRCLIRRRYSSEFYKASLSFPS